MSTSLSLAIFKSLRGARRGPYWLPRRSHTTPRPVSEYDLKLMRRLDEQGLEAPVLRRAHAHRGAAASGTRGRAPPCRHAMRCLGAEAMYRRATLNIASRKVWAWRLSNTMIADFCVEALEEALGALGPGDL